MDAAEIRDHLSTDHHVVKVSNDKVCVRQMNRQSDCSEKQARKPADQEEAHESDRVQHRRIERHRTLVERRCPVEHLDRRRHGNNHGQERKHHSGVDRLAADEHVMAPNEKPKNGDRNA